MSKERLEELLDDLPYSIRHSGELDPLKQFAREQAERVRELEETNKKNYWIAADFKFENLLLEQQNKRYREALEFYADKENYKPFDGIFLSRYQNKIDEDGGEKARKALEGEE